MLRSPRPLALAPLLALSSLLALACSDDGPAADSEGSESSSAPTETETQSETETETGDPLEPPALGLCGTEPPADASLAPALPAYGGPGSCPVLETGADALNLMQTEHGERQFYLITPSDAQPDERFPVLFMYHWLGGTAETFIDRAEAQAAADHYRVIAIVPEGRNLDTGVPLRWPISVGDDDARQDEEFAFHDDLLACVAEQFEVDKECVSTTGVSAGAMFSAMLASRHGAHLSSFISLSGGTGDGELIIQPWVPAARPMPALILWGGPTDLCLGVDFEVNSMRLEDELAADGHFFIECVHDCAHSIPPFEPPPELPLTATLFEFVLDHPFWLEPGESPYSAYVEATGSLPPAMPTWCGIGAGSATIRSGMCGAPEC